MLIDLVKHLREQNERQKTAFVLAIGGLVMLFSAVIIAQDLYWSKLVLEMITG